MALMLKKSIQPAPTQEGPKKHPRTDRGERRFDKTQLHENQHGNGVHRDYAAHYFRWGFAKNFIKKGMRVLEVGCGQDLPMAKVLQLSLGNVPSKFLAVDINKINKIPKWAWLEVKDEFNFVDDWKKLGQKDFDIATCFEVIEHMEKPDGKKLLAGLLGMLKSGGTCIISTPVYNNKHMAANHIHEYGFDELKAMILECGFKLVRVHGTFMTSQAIKRVCTPEERALVDELHEFYGWDVLANFLAPKYPKESSNCCWVLEKP